jgi:NAD+ dependent glucose-6-phosphate dehydrogenase
MVTSVLLTGAAGRVGRAILSGLDQEYDWRLLDREPATGDLADGHEYVIGDITDTETVREAMDGIDVVIHLAGDPRPEAAWDSVLTNNIDGAHTVFETAVDAGVEKVVFASSNHVVGHYESERKPDIYRESSGLLLDGTELPRPSNRYGVSKAAGETLGRFFHDEYGLSTVCVRIGNLTKDHPPIDYERGQAMWLSYRDCAHLFDCCITADFDFEIVYGISDNDRKYYSIDRAREMLGYDPQDNSAEYDDES